MKDHTQDSVTRHILELSLFLAVSKRAKGMWFVLALCLLGVPSGAAQTKQARGAPAAGQLFVDVSEADYVEVIELSTRRVVDKIVVGKRPHGLALGRHTIGGRVYDLLYVTVEESGELVIVDAEKHNVLGRARVGRQPNQLALTLDGRFAYVPLRGDSEVAVVDLGIRAKPGPASAGIEVSPRVIKRIPVGEWPHNSYTGRRTGRIYVGSFRGKKIHVFDPQSHVMLFEIAMPGEVRPIALTEDETRAYVAQSDFHGFVVVSIPERKVIARVELPPLPTGTPEPFLKTYVHGLVLSPDERELWVTSCAGAAVYVYSVPELKLQGKVPTGKFPHWFAWQHLEARGPGGNNAGRLLWVSEMDSNQVSALDPGTRKVVARIPTGPAPKRIVTRPGS